MNADPVTLQLFWESWELFREPTLAGVLAGLLLGYLGVYIVLRRMVFLSAALTQGAGLGVTLAFYLQLQLGVSAAVASPSLLALLTTLGTGAVLLGDAGASRAQRESRLGLLYLLGSAGALAVGTRIVQEVHDINSILFGSAVAVLPEDFNLIAGMTLGLMGLHVWLRRGFIQASFDRDGARVRGLPVRGLELGLMLTLALAISVCTRVLGALPVFAFSVLPAMAAVKVSRNVNSALGAAACVGAVSGGVGYLVAFLYQLPVGASQTLVGVACVGFASVVAKLLSWRR